LLPNLAVSREVPWLKLHPLGLGSIIDLDQLELRAMMSKLYILKDWLAFYPSKELSNFEA
jgi:hypothetical protein